VLTSPPTYPRCSWKIRGPVRLTDACVGLLAGALANQAAEPGTGVMNVATSMTLSQSSAAWNESITVRVTRSSATGCWPN